MFPLSRCVRLLLVALLLAYFVGTLSEARRGGRFRGGSRFRARVRYRVRGGSSYRDNGVNGEADPEALKIVGIIIGAILGFVLLVGLIIFCRGYCQATHSVSKRNAHRRSTQFQNLVFTGGKDTTPATSNDNKPTYGFSSEVTANGVSPPPPPSYEIAANYSDTSPHPYSSQAGSGASAYSSEPGSTSFD